MSAEVWTIISAAIVILVAIATSHRAMRREMNERIDALGERVTSLRMEMIERFGEVGERFGEVNERITTLRAEMNERFGKVNEHIATVRGELNERLSRVEGFLEGMGYAQWKRASKEERSDGEH